MDTPPSEGNRARVTHRNQLMARVVQKFGGTSVADVERIRNAAKKVKAEVDAGNEGIGRHAVLELVEGIDRQRFHCSWLQAPKHHTEFVLQRPSLQMIGYTRIPFDLPEATFVSE